MNDGEQLKQFIDNQAKSKISIAKDLGMSKQNLFGHSSRLMNRIYTGIEIDEGNEEIRKSNIEF